MQAPKMTSFRIYPIDLHPIPSKAWLSDLSSIFFTVPSNLLVELRRRLRDCNQAVRDALLKHHEFSCWEVTMVLCEKLATSFQLRLDFLVIQERQIFVCLPCKLQKFFVRHFEFSVQGPIIRARLAVAVESVVLQQSFTSLVPRHNVEVWTIRVEELVTLEYRPYDDNDCLVVHIHSPDVRSARVVYERRDQVASIPDQLLVLTWMLRFVEVLHSIDIAWPAADAVHVVDSDGDELSKHAGHELRIRLEDFSQFFRSRKHFQTRVE